MIREIHSFNLHPAEGQRIKGKEHSFILRCEGLPLITDGEGRDADFYLND